MRDITFGELDFSNPVGATLELSTDEAALIAMDGSNLIAAKAGTEEELLPLKKDYEAKGHTVLFYPEEREISREEWLKQLGDPVKMVKEIVKYGASLGGGMFSIDLTWLPNTKERLRFLYGGMELNSEIWIDPELCIANGHAKQYNSAYLLPTDTYALICGNGYPVVPFRTFYKEAERQKTSVQLVMDVKDDESNHLVRISCIMAIADDPIFKMMNMSNEKLSIRIIGANGNDREFVEDLISQLTVIYHSKQAEAAK